MFPVQSVKPMTVLLSFGALRKWALSPLGAISELGQSRHFDRAAQQAARAMQASTGVRYNHNARRTSSTILAIACAQLLDPAAPRYRYRWPAAAVRGADGSSPSLGRPSLGRKSSARSGLRTRPPL